MLGGSCGRLDEVLQSAVTNPPGSRWELLEASSAND